MRRAAKRDDNEAEIISDLRQVGATVYQLDKPVDLLVGFRGKNYLFEVKDGSKVKSKQKLTPDQVAFFTTWNGDVSKITTSREALIKIGVLRIEK